MNIHNSTHYQPNTRTTEITNNPGHSFVGFLVSQVVKTGLQSMAETFQSEVAVSWLGDALADTWVKQGYFKEFSDSIKGLINSETKLISNQHPQSHLYLQETDL